MKYKFQLPFFLLLSLLLIYPLLLHPGQIAGRASEISENDVGDSFLFLYYMHGFREGLTGEGSLFEFENIFYPYGLSCGDTSCALPYSIIGALLSLALPGIYAHNLLIIAFMALNGLAMYLLSKEFTDEHSALFAGFLYMISPFVLSKALLSHMDLLQLFWIPLIFLYLEKLFKKPEAKGAAIVGALLALQAFASAQLLLFFLTVVPVYVILRDGRFYKKGNLLKSFLIHLQKT